VPARTHMIQDQAGAQAYAPGRAWVYVCGWSQWAWRNPRTLPSVSSTMAASPPPPTFLTSCLVRHPAATAWRRLAARRRHGSSRRDRSCHGCGRSGQGRSRGHRPEAELVGLVGIRLHAQGGPVERLRPPVTSHRREFGSRSKSRQIRDVRVLSSSLRHWLPPRAGFVLKMPQGEQGGA